MLEELNSSCLWNMCCAIRDRTPLVYPKGKTCGRKIDPWETFFSEADQSLRWDILPKKKRLDGRSFRTGSDLVKAWRWFNEKSETIVDSYIKDQWGNDLREGMRKCGTYNNLHQDWLDYFVRRRNDFMEETNKLVSMTAEGLAKKGKMPQSHGGVANLLKVLTKTMKEQGSGIDSIAKMQYAICIQAGIYIVPEFLTDVLVADKIMSGLDKR